MTTANTSKRIPSKTLILPPGKALFFVTDKPENKFDPNNLQWSGRIVWEGEARKKVEQMIGPLLPEAHAAIVERLTEEAKGNAIKLKKIGEMEIETPWREVLNKDTAEPTGEIEIVVKRPAFKTIKGSDKKVPNSPPGVFDAFRQPTAQYIPNGAIVAVKMAYWPVYFQTDNKSSIKRLFEAVQIISMPAARKPSAEGFDEIADGWTDNGNSGEASDEAPGKAPVASGADY